MNKIKYIISLAVAILLTAADQLTKYIVVNKLEFRECRSVIKDFFYIHYVRNTGSAFSLFADKSWGIYMLSAFSLIMAVVIAFYTFKALRLSKISVAVSGLLLTVGAVGNLIDRIRLKYVIDFLRFDFGSYTFPIFNVADICAVCGTILLIAVIIFKGHEVEVLFVKERSSDKTIKEAPDETSL